MKKIHLPAIFWVLWDLCWILVPNQVHDTCAQVNSTSTITKELVVMSWRVASSLSKQCWVLLFKIFITLNTVSVLRTFIGLNSIWLFVLSKINLPRLVPSARCQTLVVWDNLSSPETVCTKKKYGSNWKWRTIRKIILKYT